ncbi:MAG: TMEM165/GDT1 family protein [Synechococcaceae cyanobacterium SM2_3_60]|nr:TMEM165/GDT1 family protein [Synechococcaceae cyanobacterium SM2_3_60]
MAALPWIGLTFATVFVAEMGDKTQLATVLMSAQGKSPWSIFLGSASALVVASVISVVLGEGLSSVLPPAVLELAAGIGFVGIGLWVLWRQWRGESNDVEA